MEILVDQLRKSDRTVTDTQGNIVGTLEKYVLTALPGDLLQVMRAVALNEIDEQQAIGNKPSQIIVDNVGIGRRAIDQAKRNIKIRFMDVDQLIKAATETYRALITVTRLQSPAKDSIVARRNFHLFIDGKDRGLLPSAISVLSAQTVNQDSIVRIVGPLVPYGRKSFWNPVGTKPKMKFRVRTSTKTTRYLSEKAGDSMFGPKFKPYSSSTTKKLMRGTGSNAAALRALVGRGAVPGRVENVGQIVRRIMRGRSGYRGLYFSDGWVDYGPARAWSKLHDARVPSISIQFAKRGATSF